MVGCAEDTDPPDEIVFVEVGTGAGQGPGVTMKGLPASCGAQHMLPGSMVTVPHVHMEETPVFKVHAAGLAIQVGL